MQSIVLWRLFRQVRVVKIFQEKISSQCWTVPITRSYCVYVTNMCTEHFKGKTDRYNGILIDSIEEPCTNETFGERLEVSLQQWITQNKRTIWFRVHIPQTEWVPILTKQNFKFHHAREEYVMLYRWLPSNEECNVPPYAHTNIGVGAFVYNQDTDEVLVVKEKNPLGVPMWKLPGGYVEPEEDIEVAAQREVSEETGVSTSFKCLIALRHSHRQAFNCSDIYSIVYLTPKSLDIQKCEREISECKWMKLGEYANHAEVHENNRMIARKMMELLQHKMGMILENTIHPITKKPICIYSISKID